jgi:hypothetical protein
VVEVRASTVLKKQSLYANIMSPQPELPEAHLAHLDSMLARKFGKEIANYFSGTEFAEIT